MAEQFKEQGGVATMDPSHVKRWLTSRLMTRISSPRAVAARHRKAERRVLKRAPAPGRLFSSGRGGYSAWYRSCSRLVERYDIKLHCHLVRGQEGKNAPEPELLARLARHDSALIAPGYGLDFPWMQRSGMQWLRWRLKFSRHNPKKIFRWWHRQ